MGEGLILWEARLRDGVAPNQKGPGANAPRQGRPLTRAPSPHRSLESPSWLATTRQAVAATRGCGQERVNLQRLSSAAWRAPKAHRLGTWAPTSVGGAET